jgi:hypothetical protein
LINLNNGGVSPAPKTVQDAMKRYYDLIAMKHPSYYMWRVLDQGREPLRKKPGEAGRLFSRGNSHQPQFFRRTGDGDFWFAVESRG